MSKNNNSLALLPNGFADLLPPHAQEEADAIRTMMNCFSGFGYQRIKPPLLEFEDSLLAPGPGARLADETFRLMDPVSHRMLGVRSDITAQVARIVSSRFSSDQRPLRLMYANDVLRTRGSQRRTERQFTQIGCELIADENSVETNIEICMLAILGVKAVGLTDITLDITIPGFVDAVLADSNADHRDALLKAVSRRDAELVQGSVLADAMKASGAVPDVMPAFDVIDFAPMAGALADLRALCDGVQTALSDLKIDDVTLTIDLLEQDGFEYHKEFGFTLFSRNVAGELGRGGSYDVHFGQEYGVQEGALAKGFTLYMDTLSKLVKPAKDEKRLCIPLSMPWHEMIELQRQEWIVVRAAEGDIPEGCTHVFKNGNITEL